MRGEIHEDDGVDPREFFKSGRGPRKQDHKANQLCRQAAETLDQVLSGEIGDPRLARLRVVSVQPAPDASRLLVTVMADCDSEDFHLLDKWRPTIRTTCTLRITSIGRM